MGFYTTSKTTKKRDKCISKKQAENSALQKKIEQQQAEIERLKVRMAELDRLYVTQGFERSDLTLTHNK